MLKLLNSEEVKTCQGSDYDSMIKIQIGGLCQHVCEKFDIEKLMDVSLRIIKQRNKLDYIKHAKSQKVSN